MEPSEGGVEGATAAGSDEFVQKKKNRGNLRKRAVDDEGEHQVKPSAHLIN